MLAMTLLALALRRPRCQSPPYLEPGRRRSGVPPGLALVLHALLGLMIYNSDLIFLRAFRSTAEVGYYVAAYTLISFLLNLGIAYSQSLLPTLTRLAPQPDRQQALYQERDGAGLRGVAARGDRRIPAGALHHPCRLRAGYSAAVLALQILIWSIPVASIAMYPQMALISANRQDRVLRITFVSAMLNLALNILVIPRYGMAGAAAATLGTEVIRTGLALGFARYEGFGLPGWARLWRVILSGGLMGAALITAQARPLWMGIGVGTATYFAGLTLTGGVRFRRGGPPALTV
jgi:O-antigen/teichoic acid export membrane protein